MEKRKITKRIRRAGPTPQEARELAKVRQQAKQDYPPRDPPRLRPAKTGIAAQIRAARQSQGLTWYAVAKLANIPNANTVRDIEYGRDAKLSNVEAVAAALGLKLELVEQTA
jgi:DNA-binding transcriptional regulator YiaG